MYQMLITVFCVIFVVGINGSSLKFSTSISDDATELAPLVEKYWSLKPAEFLNYRPMAICKFIEDCCGTEERLRAIPLMISSSRKFGNMTFPDVINECTNSAALDKADKSCLSLEEFNALPLIDEVDDPAIDQYYTLILKNVQDYLPIEHLLSEMPDSCNDYELHAYLCLTDVKLIKTCVGKALQKIYDSKGDKYYSEIIIKIKQSFIDINQRLIELSVGNTNRN